MGSIYSRDVHVYEMSSIEWLVISLGFSRLVDGWILATDQRYGRFERSDRVLVEKLATVMVNRNAKTSLFLCRAGVCVRPILH